MLVVCLVDIAYVSVFILVLFVGLVLGMPIFVVRVRNIRRAISRMLLRTSGNNRTSSGPFMSVIVRT